MSLLRVKGLGKSFRSYRSELQRFARWFGIPVKPSEEHWVLRDINFNIEPGESVGIIGQNGAGKSTLLKMITGTLQPTEGQVQINGRIAAILELGMGFNPELTGRQNVFHAAGLMGFSAEQIQQAIPDIEAFAEIGEYFDQPVRTYSSGMQMRVAFAVATAHRPEILIIDEALSVGDSYFQHKSFNRIIEFKEQGTSLLFVTHSLSDIRTLCDRAILLSNGEVLKDGLPDEIVDYYNAITAERENAKLSIEQRRMKDGWIHTEYGTREAVVESIQLLDSMNGTDVSLATVGQDLVIETRVKIKEDLPRVVLGHRIMDRSGHLVWGTNTWHTKQVIEDVHRGSVITFRVTFNCRLGPGSYSVSFGLVSSEDHLENCYHKSDNPLVFDVVNVDKTTFVGSNWLDPVIEIRVIK